MIFTDYILATICETKPYQSIKTDMGVILRLLQGVLPHPACSLIQGTIVYGICPRRFIASLNLDYDVPKRLEKWLELWLVCCSCWALSPQCRPSAPLVGWKLQPCDAPELSNIPEHWFDDFVGYLGIMLVNLLSKRRKFDNNDAQDHDHVIAQDFKAN